MVIFHEYVGLPEGNPSQKLGQSWWGSSCHEKPNMLETTNQQIEMICGHCLRAPDWITGSFSMTPGGDYGGHNDRRGEGQVWIHIARNRQEMRSFCQTLGAVKDGKHMLALCCAPKL